MKDAKDTKRSRGFLTRVEGPRESDARVADDARTRTGGGDARRGAPGRAHRALTPRSTSVHSNRYCRPRGGVEVAESRATGRNAAAPPPTRGQRRRGRQARRKTRSGGAAGEDASVRALAFGATRTFMFREACTRAGDDAGTLGRARARPRTARARRVLFMDTESTLVKFLAFRGSARHRTSFAVHVRRHTVARSACRARHVGPSDDEAPESSRSSVPHPRVSPFAAGHRHRWGRRRAWCADSPPTRDAAHALTHPTSPRASPRRAQGKEAVLATRTREVAARRTAGESAKRRRAERVASRAEETATRPKKASDDGSDDEVEDLDEDVVHAVADRHLAQPRARHHRDAREAQQEAASARRAARAKPREYVGGGVWRRTGTGGRGGPGDDGRDGGAEAARAFLARRDAGGRNKRASSMLLDPKTGKPLRAGGVTALGVGKKRRR